MSTGSTSPAVELRPQVLKDIQDAVGATVCKQRPLDLVFHGGSGSSPADIRESLTHGVVKMNIDTDTQYAFTRAVAHHAFTNYAGVLKLDGELGDKKAYDPRAYGKLAEAAMAARVAQACEDLRSTGTALAG
jgi:fructose-bisphosphate aldolase class II